MVSVLEDFFGGVSGRFQIEGLGPQKLGVDRRETGADGNGGRGMLGGEIGRARLRVDFRGGVGGRFQIEGTGPDKPRAEGREIGGSCTCGREVSMHRAVPQPALEFISSSTICGCAAATSSNFEDSFLERHIVRPFPKYVFPPRANFAPVPVDTMVFTEDISDQVSKG